MKSILVFNALVQQTFVFAVEAFNRENEQIPAWMQIAKMICKTI